MRKWYKYNLDYYRRSINYVGIDSQFNEHAQGMGNYKADESYRSESDLLNKYFYGYQYGRFQYYDDFLRKSLGEKCRMLSLASGRAVNELRLMNYGYSVVCSDLEIIDAYESTKMLFPDFTYLKLNILENPAEEKFNAVICLSLIYLFDKSSLLTFFKNVSSSLNIGGYLILDSAGSSDNWMSFLLHDIYLKYETMFIGFVKFLCTGRMPGLVVKHFGYRKTDDEIINLAASAGLKLVKQSNYAFVTEFRRSIIFNRLVREGSCLENIFAAIGRSIPYIRMYKFKKVY